MIIDIDSAIRFHKRKSSIYKDYKRCPFCNQSIIARDYEDKNIGYIKTKLNEVYYHIECYEKKKASYKENRKNNIEVAFWNEFHENYIEED